VANAVNLRILREYHSGTINWLPVVSYLDLPNCVFLF
jgi:hypothetical protein